MRMIIPLHRAKRKKTFCSSSWSFTFNCSGGIIPSVVSLQHRQKSFSCAFHWCATNVIHFWKIKFNWTWKSDLQERLFWQPYLADVADVLFACGSFLPRWKISSHSEDTWSALFPHRNREIPVVNSQGSWKRNWLRHLVHSKFPRKYLGVQWNSYHSAMESWVPPRWSFSRRGWLPPLNLEMGRKDVFFSVAVEGNFFRAIFWVWGLPSKDSRLFIWWNSQIGRPAHLTRMGRSWGGPIRMWSTAWITIASSSRCWVLWMSLMLFGGHF